MNAKILYLVSFLFFAPLSFASYDTSKIQLVTTASDMIKKDKILREYEYWKGVRYKLGGSSVNGIDCSALVQKIYHSAFLDELPSKLPRTTAHQIRHGTYASKHDLQTGDLIFFQMSRNERHVGVYIGEHKFIHASSSHGVMISDLNNRYWDKRYKTARRLL